MDIRAFCVNKLSLKQAIHQESDDSTKTKRGVMRLKFKDGMGTVIREYLLKHYWFEMLVLLMPRNRQRVGLLY